MAKRKTIALIFSYNEGWIAGSYYVMNLVHALKTLPKNEMPCLVICANTNDFSILKNETEYPFLKHYNPDSNLPFLKRVLNFTGRYFFKKTLFEQRLNCSNIKCVYPYFGFGEEKYSLLKKLYWIADFQHLHYPNFFNKKELEQRSIMYNKILNEENYVVLSSKSALLDAQQFFPSFKAKVFVLPFAVTLPTQINVDFQSIKVKYSLPDRYFFSPNQFWQHKNHITILKAILVLKKQGIEAFTVFSGKEQDSRNAEYVHSLKQFCKEADIVKNVFFLGFLDRKEQLCIMKNCLSVIQPSLFEGWSTVVEDCKALNVNVLISNLPVHYEQISENCDFFDKHDENALSKLMKIRLENQSIIIKYKYSDFQKQFAAKFINIIDEM